MLHNRTRRPTHPGEVLRAEILPETGLTQTKLAHRLARVFQTTPELWLNLQQAVAVWESYQAHRTTYEQITPFGERQAA